MLVDEPELGKVEGEAVVGYISEELSGTGDFETVFVGFDELEIFEVLEEESQID